MSLDQENSGEFLRIKRGKVDSLSVYEITDYELSQILEGSPNALYLNLSIFFISVFISFLISLLTSILSDRVYIIFVVITTVSLVSGGVFCIMWWRARSRVGDLVKKIMARIPS